MRRRSAGAATVLVLALAGVALSLPAAVQAQPVSLAGTPLEVQIWPGGEMGYTLLIVTGHIPEDTPLPATVRLPLPRARRSSGPARSSEACR
jgi:hypothetical protein